MHLRRLTLAHFRTYRSLQLVLDAGPSVFIGENAHGKTNLLEAIELLAVARTERAEHDGEVVAWGAPDRPAFARVEGEVERRGGPLRVEVLVTLQGPPDFEPGPGHVPRAGKRLRLNGVPRRSADFVGQFAAAMYSVDDIELISGAPAVRRRYLDLTLSQSDRAYGRALQRYSRVLQQRNSLLRRIGQGAARADELLFWNDELVTNGALLFRARARALGSLGSEAGAAHAALTEERERLTLTYEPRLPESDGPALIAAATADVERAFHAALRDAMPREIGAGMTLVGPHRDDVRFLIGDAPAGAFGSRAQQRTAALALRLAEARYLRERTGETPVLLLDDVLSEMDERRRLAVLDAIAEFDQALITTTDRDRLPSAFLARSALFTVETGSVRPA